MTPARKFNTLAFQLRWAKDREREQRQYHGTAEEIAATQATIARLEAEIGVIAVALWPTN